MTHFLWTDRLLLGILLALIGLLMSNLRQAPFRTAFFDAFSKPWIRSASIIFLFFLMIGILDSIHIQWRVQAVNESVLSIKQGTVLDYLLSPLDDFDEKTYSAPLSLHLYNTETALIAGKATQYYPSLNYPDGFIKNATQKNYFIHYSLVKAGLYSLACLSGMVLIFLLIQRVRLRRFYSPFSKHNLGPWLVLLTCFYGLWVCFFLSRHLHVLGTGKIGQDIFYYTVKSIHTGLVIGLLTTLFMLPLAIIFGMLAGYFGGLVDDIIQYVYTTLSAVPGVLLITASVLAMQTYIVNHPEQFPTLTQSADARLLALCFILGITSWTSLCRILRAETLKLRELDFVQASKALGSRTWTIFCKHLLPNMMPIILINVILDFSFLILAEAVLSYVGVGVSPMTISWGNMINSARLELAREPIVWWPIAAAFGMMFTLVLASNLVADALRDAFDPYSHRF